MTTKDDLFALETVVDVDRFGSKASNLRWLVDHGAMVPQSWVVAPGAHLTSRALRVLRDDGAYAVRSSATVEDGIDFSFAGQFTTKLDVRGLKSVMAAIGEVQASATRDVVATYLEQVGYDSTTIEMGVIVQEMVTPVVSGVAFSRNPITSLNEIVIEAVSGRGDQLVGGGVTPDRWVHRWGGFTEGPRSSSLPDPVARAVVDHVREIAAAYGRAVDLEWVWDGQRVWFVQLRPITGIDDVAVFSNRISREVMPGIIKPLVWSVNVPVVNSAWIELITEAIGPNDLRPDDLARSFGYRAYFNMGAFGDIFEAFGMPRDALELLLGLPESEERPSFRPTTTTIRKTPRLAAMAWRKLRLVRRAPAEMDRLRSEYASFADQPLDEYANDQLTAEIEQLKQITQRAASLNIVIPLLANIANGFLRRTLTKAGLDAEEVAVSSLSELAGVNPQAALAKLGAELAQLPEPARDRIRREGYPAIPDYLRPEVDEFLDRFGHFSMSGNDLSVPPWRETPDAVMRLLVDTGDDSASAPRIPWDVAEQSLPKVSQLPARMLFRQTRTLIQLREQVSSLYTYGYGLLRPYYLALGKHMATTGHLQDPEDVMYLTDGELRSAMNDPSIDLRARVETRKAEIEAAASLVMPETIIGDDYVPAGPEAVTGHSLTGVATARGRYRGTVRVVTTLGDFERVAMGDVIAIPFSDVGWTPLFARAGAVIAEAGGLLSHGSIVAREYGIPCVVSVGGALQIPDGTTVVVDGYEGTVQIEESVPPG